MDMEDKKRLEGFDREIRLAIATAACLLLAANSGLTPRDAVGDAYQVFAAVFPQKEAQKK